MTQTSPPWCLQWDIRASLGAVTTARHTEEKPGCSRSFRLQPGLPGGRSVAVNTRSFIDQTDGASSESSPLHLPCPNPPKKLNLSLLHTLAPQLLDDLKVSPPLPEGQANFARAFHERTYGKT